MTQTHDRRALLAVALMFFANGFAFATWVSRIPAIQSKLNLEPGPLGLALLAIGFGAMGSMQLGGSLSAKLGSRTVTVSTLILTAAALAAIPLAGSLLQLALILFVFGIFASAMDIAMNAHGVAVQRLFDKPVLSRLHALWSVGGMIAAAFGGWMAELQIQPSDHFIYVALFLVVLAGSAYFSLLPKSRELNIPVREVEGAAPGRGLVPGGKGAVVVMLIVICFLAFMGEGAVADWSALYFERTLHTTAAFAPLGFSAFSLSMSVGRFMGDVANKNFGANNLLRYGSLLGAVGAGLVVTLSNQWVAMTGFIVAGLGMANIVPIVFTLAGDIDAANTAKSIARVALAGYLGLLVGPAMLGFAANAFGLQVTIIAVSVICAIIFLLAQSLDCTRGCLE